MTKAVGDWRGPVGTGGISVRGSRSHDLSGQIVEREILMAAQEHQAGRESFPRQSGGFLTRIRIEQCMQASTLYPIKLTEAAASPALQLLLT